MLVQESWKLMELCLQGGSNVLYNEVVENEVVSERRQRGRTGIPDRKLSLRTRVDGAVAHVHRTGNNKAWMRSFEED